MKPELFGDRVLIKPDIPINITKGGIFIPDSASRLDEKKTGIVICHGEGFTDESTRELFPIEVWEGCKVSFAAYLGEEFLGSDIGMEDNEIYLLINERDIDVILVKDEIDLKWEVHYSKMAKDRFRVAEINAFNL